MFLINKIQNMGLDGLLKAIAWIGIFLAPVKELLIVTLFFIACDFFTGAWRSVKLEGWASIRSEKIWRTMEKVVLYMIGVVVSFVAQKYVLHDSIPFIQIITGFICMAEIKSIYENIGETMNVDIWNAIKGYMSKK